MGQKGSVFEREFCVKLSQWWSDHSRDDLFWRTAGSGARAKVRGRRGSRTHGQHGDICATHPSAEPLIDLLTIELKRGYSNHTMADLLDKPRHAALQTWEKWLLQCEESAQNAGSFSWLMVQRRDKRVPVVFFPYNLSEQLEDLGCVFPDPCFSFRVTVEGRRRHFGEIVTATTLFNWFDCVSPQDIRLLAQRV
jgi:hypothetical protein